MTTCYHMVAVTGGHVIERTAPSCCDGHESKAPFSVSNQGIINNILFQEQIYS